MTVSLNFRAGDFEGADGITFSYCHSDRKYLAEKNGIVASGDNAGEALRNLIDQIKEDTYPK